MNNSINISIIICGKPNKRAATSRATTTTTIATATKATSTASNNDINSNNCNIVSIGSLNNQMQMRNKGNNNSKP